MKGSKYRVFWIQKRYFSLENPEIVSMCKLYDWTKIGERLASWISTGFNSFKFTYKPKLIYLPWLCSLFRQTCQFHFSIILILIVFIFEFVLLYFKPKKSCMIIKSIPDDEREKRKHWSFYIIWVMLRIDFNTQKCVKETLSNWQKCANSL